MVRKGWLNASGSVRCLSRRSIKTSNPRLHRRNSASFPTEPTVTVMKADSQLQIDPSTVGIIDATRARVDWGPL